MVIECRHQDTNLPTAQPSQLARAFGSTGAKIGVFTNGLVYQFYTDQDRAGVMDADPFWTYDVLQGGDEEIEQLKKFARTGFDRNHVVHGARELAYTAASGACCRSRCSSRRTSSCSWWPHTCTQGA